VVTLDDEPWLELELELFEDEEPLDDEPLDVVPLVLDESSEDEPLEVDELSDDDPLDVVESSEEPVDVDESSEEPLDVDVPVVVVALDVPLVPACCDAAVADVVPPRYPVAAIVPKAIAKVAMAAAATRRRIIRARRARARRRSRTSWEFGVGVWFSGIGAR